MLDELGETGAGMVLGGVPPPAPVEPRPVRSDELRVFIRGHLEYHMNNLAEMKVLVRETECLPEALAARHWDVRKRRLFWPLRWRDGLATMTDEDLDTVGRSAYPHGLDPELPREQWEAALPLETSGYLARILGG